MITMCLHQASELYLVLSKTSCYEICGANSFFFLHFLSIQSSMLHYKNLYTSIYEVYTSFINVFIIAFGFLFYLLLYLLISKDAETLRIYIIEGLKIWIWSTRKISNFGIYLSLLNQFLLLVVSIEWLQTFT